MKIYLTSLFLLVLSFLGTSVAMAQGEDLGELAKPVLDAIMGGQYALGAALGLVLAVALLRRYGSDRWPVLDSSAAGSILVLVGGFGAASATSITAGEALSWALAYSALKVALFAAGGFSILKPLVLALQGKAPSWAKPVLGLVGWVFDKPNKAARAEAVGAAAVEASPGEGSQIAFRDFE